MANRLPLVVSDAGGLPEVVRNGVTGTTTYAGNPNSLADGILSVLHQPDKAKAMAEAGYQEVLTTFSWTRIATQTIATYRRVLDEYAKSLQPESEVPELTIPLSSDLEDLEP
jgi:glycogen synthase